MERGKRREFPLGECKECEWVYPHIVQPALQLAFPLHDLPVKNDKGM